MRVFALFVLAAVAFSLLAGAIEALWERLERRQLETKASNVVAPVGQRWLRSVRDPLSSRALFHARLFVGFLFAAMIVTLLLKVGHTVVAWWFS